jgi:hypothetical protein
MKGIGGWKTCEKERGGEYGETGGKEKDERRVEMKGRERSDEGTSRRSCISFVRRGEGRWMQMENWSGRGMREWRIAKMASEK